MPIYEYACAGCDSEFEVEQRITEDPLKTCPKCRSRRIKRLISRTSFALKGGGWYADGYGSSKAEPAKGDEGAAPSGTSSGDAAKKDDASAKKPSSKAGKDKKAVA